MEVRSNACSGTANVCAELRATIERGAPLYNAGRARECAELYYDVAKRVLAAEPELPDDYRQVLRAAMTRAGAAYRENPNSAEGPAWTLRHAFDYVLKSSEPVTPSLDDNPFRASSSTTMMASADTARNNAAVGLPAPVLACSVPAPIVRHTPVSPFFSHT